MRGNPGSNWTVERHGGGRKHGWRVAFTGNEKPARNQLRLGRHQMSQGGVRLVNPAGVILEAYWERHAPGAIPHPIKFCIGCGCHDYNACVDPLDEGVPCSWIAQDKRTATGVCSSCPRSLKRWRKGDRRVFPRNEDQP